MTHIETARFNDVIGLQIGTIQEAAQKLNRGRAVEELETEIAELERTIADLKGSLEGVPHKHQ
jgi:polyhydroxyalkanoate synthesis regulator phasin